MDVTVHIPDEAAAHLPTKNDELPRRLLEAYALEGYKSGELSAYQVQVMLGFETPMEVDGFLKRRGVYLEYTEEDLEEDTETSRRISAQHQKR